MKFFTTCIFILFSFLPGMAQQDSIHLFDQIDPINLKDGWKLDHKIYEGINRATTNTIIFRKAVLTDQQVILTNSTFSPKLLYSLSNTQQLWKKELELIFNSKISSFKSSLN